MKNELTIYAIVVAMTLAFPAGYYFYVSGHFEAEAKKASVLAEKAQSVAEQIEQGKAHIQTDDLPAMFRRFAAADRALSDSLSGYGSALNNFALALIGAGLAQAGLLAGLYLRRRF